MKRYYIVEGDVTSVGGIVQRHTGSAQTTTVYDKIVSNIGDKINCPACSSIGNIGAVGHRQPFGNHSNIPAMENDICICKCSPAPILKHSQELFYQDVDYSIASAMEAFNLSLPSSSQNLHSNLVPEQNEKKECFCNKDISLELFRLILPTDIFTKGLFYRSTYPKIKNLDIQKFLDLLNEAMEKFAINTCLRKAHFLAQISCEGDFFRTTEEYKNKNGSIPSHWNNYEGGHEYHGRGLIQLTHKTNYIKYGKTVGVNFTLTNIHLVASEPEHVVNSAVWYWLKGSAWGNGNTYADVDDVHYITMLVNGGFNHYCDRKHHLLNLIEKMQIKELCEKSKQSSKTIGNYNFSTSALSKSKVGPKIWANYQKNSSLKKYISCEL